MGKLGDQFEQQAHDWVLPDIQEYFGVTNISDLTRENIQEMGSLLWKIVYNQKSVEQCLKIMGIDFTDARTILDSDHLKLNNYLAKENI